jgi:hypothetical protein
MRNSTRNHLKNFLLLLTFLSFSISGFAQQMDLRGNSEYTPGQCPANDVQIISAEVDLGSACNDCSPGDLITADILITVLHGTNSANRFLAVMGDLTETFSSGGSAMSTFAECSGPLDKSNDPSGGLTTLNYGQITFTCGSELVLDNILLVWTASMGECPVTPANNPNGKYCYANPIINITPPLNAMASASCTSGDNVDVDLTVQGGVMPFTYVWNNGATTEDLSDVTPGTYSVTATGADGCTAMTSITVGPALAASGTLSDVLCFGDATGAIDLLVSGGVAPLTISWDSGQATEDISGLTAGDYSVTITDGLGCEITKNFTIAEPAELTCSVVQGNPASSGNSDGSATVTALEGTSAYTYLWDNGESTQTATALNGGDHTVTVTDANGCQTTCEVTIQELDPLECSIALVQDEQCFGDEDGSATANPVGGVAPYMYSWSNGETDQTAIGLAQGLHTVTVTDANGATTDCEITIGGPSASLAADAISVDVLCFGELTGSVDLTVSGGTTAYTYLWDNGATTQDLADVAAGTYNVTITDANLCTTTASATVGQPAAALAADSISVDVLCFGELTGSVDLTVSGGTTAYTYLWDNGATTQDLADVAAGTYNVTITDANGCTTTASATVGQPAAALTCSIALDSGVSVNGASDGSATVSALGGTTSYSYDWDNGETTEQATGLNAGAHTVTVTDANGCETTCEVTIPQPDELVCSIALVQDEQCFGDENGSATANPVGGVAPYTYSWSNGETNQTAIGLAQGLHTVTVTDANGATTICEIMITEPEPADAGVDNEITVCDGELVDLTTLVSVEGGSFSEVIITGGLDETSFDTTGLSLGTYEVIYTVEAGETCPADTAVITINVDEIIEAGGDKELAVCESTVIDLSTLVGIAGGTFTPQGDGLIGSTLDTSGFAPGEYMYTYTIDGNGTCPGDTAIVTIMISEDIIDKECKVIDADFCDASTDPFYNFYWGAMNGVSGSAFFAQDATHKLIFTQFNNGTAIITGTTQQNGCSAELYIFLEDKKDYAQWTADGGNFKAQGCAGTIKEAMVYYVIDGSRSWVKTTGDCVEEGTYIITQRPDPNDISTPNLGVHVGPGGALWDSNQGAEGLAGWAWMGPQGDEQRWKIDFNFLLDCEEKVGCVIDDPDALDCEIADRTEDVDCNGGNDGSATVIVAGGSLPYSYLWSNGETTMTAINLKAGAHTVTITDGENVSTQCSVTIAQPELLECSVALVNGVSTSGVSDGSAAVTPTGGTADFTYLWDNNETTQTAVSLSAGAHMVTVTDANGCESNCSVDVPEPGLLACEATGRDVSCYDGLDGTASVTPVGGLEPYTYSWSNGDTTNSITGLVAGNYEVTVSDANGRETKCEVEIVQPNESLSCMALTFLNVTKHGESDGVATVTASGGTMPFTYLWDNGETTAMAEALNAGDHTVVVTDANGCSSECLVTIMQPDPPTPEICDGIDNNGDGTIDEGFADADGDGIADCVDICLRGDDSSDADGDGVPDSCDVCAAGDDSLDVDGDGVPDSCDICALGDDSVDADGDGKPDACDDCDANVDTDDDGVADCDDICPAGDDSLDADGDGVPDACDDCTAGDDSADTDGDGVPDACDTEECDGVDNNGDGEIDEALNCDDTTAVCETAFARFNDGFDEGNTCFIEDGFNRWGWTNYFAVEGDYMLDLYSGAGQCDLSKGEKSGNVQVEYDGENVFVTIELLDGFVMTEAQLYVGGVPYPVKGNKETVAPGQYPQNAGSLNEVIKYEFDPINVSALDDGIHVIVHAVTCKKSKDAGKVLKTQVTAYPMTFKDELNLIVEIPYDAQLEVEMFDMNGRCVMTKKGMNVKAGSNDVHMNVSSLAPNMYILVVNTGREKVFKKVLSKK